MRQLAALTVAVVTVLWSSAAGAERPDEWTQSDGTIEVGFGAGVSASSYANPVFGFVDLAVIRRGRKGNFVKTLYLGNEHGARLRVAVGGAGHLQGDHDREITLSMRPTLAVAPPGKKLRGPSFLDVLLPEAGVVLTGDGEIRGARLGLFRTSITRVLGHGTALRIEPEVAILLPFDDEDGIVTLGVTLAVVRL